MNKRKVVRFMRKLHNALLRITTLVALSALMIACLMTGSENAPMLEIAITVAASCMWLMLFAIANEDREEDDGYLGRLVTRIEEKAEIRKKYRNLTKARRLVRKAG